MQIAFTEQGWYDALDQCIRRYLENGGDAVLLPNHSECSFESPSIVLRKDGQELGRFELLSVDVHVGYISARDHTLYQPRTKRC